jgi:hypothetical protein
MIDYVWRCRRCLVPTLFARRYVRPIESVSRTERILGVLIMLLVAAIVAAFGVQVATNRDFLFNAEVNSASNVNPPENTAESANPFPDPGLPGWRAPTKAERFTPDGLYLKIDGRAEVYLQHHVVGLIFGTYTYEGQADRTVDVYWYDMGTADNARQMYESEVAPGVTAVSIGDAGCQVSGAVFFHADSSYVQILPSRPDEEDGRAALKFAERIAAGLTSKP